MEKSALVKKYAAAAGEIARRHALRLLVLYGSVARGTATRESDIDIAILGRAPLIPEDEAVIAEELALATGESRIEVRSLHRASPLFVETVLREGVVLYEDAPELARFLSLYAWKLSKETAYLREARYRRARERIAAHVE